MRVRGDWSACKLFVDRLGVKDKIVYTACSMNIHVEACAFVNYIWELPQTVTIPEFTAQYPKAIQIERIIGE